MVGGVLEAELETYERNRETLLADSGGMFVLIKTGDVVGVYETKNDAIAEGYRRFGNVPFLVKRVVESEAPLNFTSNLIGT